MLMPNGSRQCNKCSGWNSWKDGKHTCQCGCWKQAQLAALRQRLGDIAASVYDPDDKSTDDWLLCQTATFFRGVRRMFAVADDIAVSNWHRPNLDSLAAWLWERGCRA